ncbi:hypothetical protein KLJ49_02040 [Clostridioides difficile]|uniref:hypothetical protein n=1 Tax=Clostridioides difficile TaxID=1496 RepID=UPI001C16A5B7|nr:hypothetical protein [Clostridioides difficile]MCM4125821.1 hypothetical protein [Clostridioides difficile]MDM0261832.1 hypothetical protein [Clostridioides difficile]MDM0346271.1 hypothetical protein [Clostridioides difficile]MDM0379344.1 hypothetical protein [Clostridioides difficile]
MNKKKKLIGIAISFLLIISIINPLQVEAEAIIESSVYISSIKENYTYDNTKFKTIKSKSRHKSKVKLKKRSIRTKKYGYQTINKYKRRNARRHNILTKLVLSIIVIFLVIVLVVLIFIKRKKKKFY